MTRAASIAVLTVAMLCGCKSIKEGARQHFSKDFTCPIDRIEVKPRKDLRVSDFEKPNTPSDEIAADPERLAMWEADQKKNQEWSDNHDDIIEARGCGHEALYACHRHNKDTNYIMCSSKKLPTD